MVSAALNNAARTASATIAGCRCGAPRAAAMVATASRLAAYRRTFRRAGMVFASLVDPSHGVPTNDEGSRTGHAIGDSGGSALG